MVPISLPLMPRVRIGDAHLANPKISRICQHTRYYHRLYTAMADAPDEAIFRLAPMCLVQFYVTIELARDLVFQLGQQGCVHFRDLNLKLTPFQRTFVDEVKRIDELEAKLRYIRGLMDKYNTLLLYFDVLEATAQRLCPVLEYDAISDIIHSASSRLEQLDESYDRLQLQLDRLLENKLVLEAYTAFTSNTLTAARMLTDLDELDRLRMYEEFDIVLEDESDTENVALTNSMAGTIDKNKIPVLRKVLWRALRGNLYFNEVELPDHDRLVFILFAHGDVLKAKARKIIGTLDGVIYDNVKGSRAMRQETIDEINAKVSDLNNIVDSTKQHLVTELMLLQERYADYAFQITREKSIYEVLNMFDQDLTRRCLVGEGWIPDDEYHTVQLVLLRLVADKLGHNRRTLLVLEVITIDDDDETFASAVIDSDDLVAVMNHLTTNRTPPTYHRTNKFTEAFQAIIDAYGIATYQEVNPGLATIITFPFMFAIMFGDFGHGVILFLMALYLVINEKLIGLIRNRDEIFDMAYLGRYILLLMGGFSLYTGIIYNDVFSKLMTIFPSGWQWPEKFEAGAQLIASKVEGYTYPFGLDWGWHGTENNLLFTNSYKMKLLVLMGYIHMNYSLMFLLVNFRFFNLWVDIVGNFIPSFLFMQLIFGYLTITIIYKWCVDWLGTGRQPPGLLNMLINMFLSPGKVDVPLYPGQSIIQVILLLVALICVPWLLIYKPYVLNRQHKLILRDGPQYSQLDQQLDRLDGGSRHSADSFDLELEHFPNEDLALDAGGGHGHGDEFNLGDVVIHQVIHTIEFCLNCVSHTASYLRLWALSLAHAQLLTVLWDMTIQNAFGSTGTKGVIMTVILFGMWFVLTVAILVVMEGTSAMLHSLRLHWVEAMSKFFQGEGYAFTPFKFSIEVN